MLISDEPCIGQLFVTVLAAEAARMPVGGHGLDHTTHNKFPAFVATGCEEHLEVPLAVLAAFELVEDTVGERAKALGAPRRRWGLY